MYKNSSQFGANQNQSGPPIERIGLIPRSIIRTLNRFLTQIFPNSNILVIQEFRVSRYQVLVSFQCLLLLIFIPLFINILSRTFVFAPLTEYIWNTEQEDIFLNLYLEKSALTELQDFEQQLIFDSFLNPSQPVTDKKELEFLLQQPLSATGTIASSYDPFPESMKLAIQKKTVDLATEYNQTSIDSLTNLFVDLSTFGTLGLLITILKPQVIILKSFLMESIYSLSDTTKSFLLLLGTDLLVGFHSPRGWELFLEFVLNRFGFPHNENFIFLFVATFPVLLDTVFKYWIFRYLNKISPSTVATYHAMIE